MNEKEASIFLEENQPLPDDEKLSEDLINKFVKVREYLISNPAPKFIPLMLNVFGDGSGFGTYQVCDDFFNKFEKNEIVPHLAKALKSQQRGVRYWASQWAMDFPDKRLVPLLHNMLNDLNSNCHYFAIASLEFIWKEEECNEALDIIRSLKGKFADPEINELIDGILHEASS